MPSLRESPARLARCAIWALFCLALSPSLAQQRAYLDRADIEQTLIGRGIVSRNLATGMVSHWEFRPDGRVDFSNRSGPGSASGTWFIRNDGKMCVTMVARTGCRYWFRTGGTVANANTNEPDAPTVAEIRFE